MSESGNFWAICNAQSRDILVWLEPWAEEFRIPHRSFLTFEINSSASQSTFPEVEVQNEHIVVWAHGGDLIRVCIDGVVQDTGSAEFAVPDIPNLFPKQFLQIAFDSQSAARSEGKVSGAKLAKSTLRRLRDWFGR